MRGTDEQQNHMFSYLSPEKRVPKDHPLRVIRTMVDQVLAQLSRRFDGMYASVGRPSIPPEKLLRAQLLQMLYTIRSERLLMEEIDYNLLFRWFVGLNADDEVWDPTTFTKNRDRLLQADVAKEFLAQVVAQAGAQGLTSDEHFTVDGTLLEAWAGAKTFQAKEGKPGPPPDDPGNPTVDFHGERRSNETHESKTDPEAQGAQRTGQGVEVELHRESVGGEPQRTDRGGGSVSSQWDGRTGCGTGDVGELAGHATGNGGRRQGIRHAGIRGRVPEYQRDAACGAEPQTAWRQRDRWTHDEAPGLCHQPKKEEANRRVLRLAEDDCADAQAAAPWSLQGGLDLHVRLRGLQSGAHAKPRGRSSCGVSRGRSVSRSAKRWRWGLEKH